MNKEELDLIQCDLVLTYIKNKDYSTHYIRRTDGVAVDNDVLGNEDNLYITTMKKYNDLQQENKQLHERINKAIKEIDHIIELHEIVNGEIYPTRYGMIKEILKGGDTDE